MSEPAAPEREIPLDLDPNSADAEFFSPFEEDELDVPTFLRRGNKDDEEEDPDEPAFLRRSAD